MTAAQLAALWASVSSGVQAGATVKPPTLDASVWSTVADGRVAKFYSGEAERRVVAVGIIPYNRASVWLSITDDQLSASVSGLTEIPLAGRWASPKTLYQRLDMPWPVEDRHWVIRLTNNTALATAANVWERAWTVDNAQLPEARARTDAEAFDASQVVATNLGSWLLVDTGESSTLAVYQAKVSMGGQVPDDLVDSFTKGQLGSMFNGVAKNVALVRRRYGMGCDAQPGGDGRIIPCF